MSVQKKLYSILAIGSSAPRLAGPPPGRFHPSLQTFPAGPAAELDWYLPRAAPRLQTNSQLVKNCFSLFIYLPWFSLELLF